MSINSAERLPVPGLPKFAVAADDPCMFDATVWCANSFGGELGMDSWGSSAIANAGGPCDDLLSTLQGQLTQVIAFGDWIFNHLSELADANNTSINGALMDQFNIVQPIFEGYVSNSIDFLNNCVLAGVRPS